MNNNTPLIELKNVTKKYDNKTIVDSLNLTINQGEFLTILGPSGCGKTTVLRMIAGLEDVDSGSIHLESQEITLVGAEKRQINTVFQNYSLFPHMTVFENVAFGLRMKGIKQGIDEKVEAALDMVQLKGFMHRKPASLSGGQQQRVAIARAVVNKPKILLLDESLSALDYKLRLEMQSELKRIQRKLGIAFFFVTHDQEEALTMSDRIIVMRNGIIEQDGTPREIYEEPKNLFVAKFIGEINIFEVTVISRIDEQQVLVNCEDQFQVSISYTAAVTVGQKLQVLLRPEDLRITEVAVDYQGKDGILGKVVDRNYKGMTLDSVIMMDNQKLLKSSEFFNEDDPDVDHSLNQRVLVNWVPGWEVVLDETS